MNNAEKSPPVLQASLDGIYSNLLEDLFREENTVLVERALLALASDASVREEAPDAGRLVEEYLAARDTGDNAERECGLINLYLCLHAAGAGYSQAEGRVMKERHGIACQPGGLSPLILAERFIGPETTVADLGAGNGLQGLLLQCIRPHARTVQVELSAEMLRVGRVFQRALGIGDERMEWVNADIAEAALDETDFVYLYRPAKPHESGNDLYQSIAGKLAAVPKPLVVMSVADCLGKFLDGRFRVLYRNEHLTCFTNDK